MKNNIPTKVIVYARPNGRKESFPKLRHLRYVQKAEAPPRKLLHFNSFKMINNLTLQLFTDEGLGYCYQQHFRVFDQCLRVLSRNISTKFSIAEPACLGFAPLKSLIMQLSRIRQLSIPIKNKYSKLMHYLKQLKSLKISSGLDPEMILHDHHDPMKLSYLKNLEFLTVNLDHLNHGMEIKHLCYLTTAFSKQHLKAKVSLQSKGLVLLDKTMTTVPNLVGAAQVFSLNCGYMDEDSFCFIVRESNPFANLKELSFTLKISNRNLNHFAMLLPWLRDLEHLKILNASYMFPFFNFNSEEFFKHFELPKNLEVLALSFYPVALCPLKDLPNSDFLCFGTQLTGLQRLKKLDLHFVVSAHMDSLYFLLGGLPFNSDQLLKLGLKLEYHVEPSSIEDNDISELFKWISKLRNVQDLSLMLDYPIYSRMDQLLSFEPLTNLYRFVLNVPNPKDKKEIFDGLDACQLGCLLKFIEPSSEKLRDFEFNIASPNFDNECFGIMLHAIDEMKHLNKLECDIHSDNFDRNVFQEFEKEVKSLTTLSETHIETSMPSKVEKSHEQGSFFNKVSNLFKRRH